MIKILLADDHIIVRDGLKLILEAYPDMRVLGAVVNGRDAVRLALELKPDVVVMDISMLELNGIEATRQILAENPLIKVVILSMYASPEYIYRTLDAGAMGYILKDSASLEVSEAVRAVWSGERYLSQRIASTLAEEYMRVRDTHPEEDPLATLSKREREILQLVVEGRSSSEIAEQLVLSPKTVESYRSRVMKKLGIEDLPSLVKFAIRHGIISLD